MSSLLVYLATFSAMLLPTLLALYSSVSGGLKLLTLAEILGRIGSSAFFFRASFNLLISAFPYSLPSKLFFLGLGRESIIF